MNRFLFYIIIFCTFFDGLIAQESLFIGKGDIFSENLVCIKSAPNEYNEEYSSKSIIGFNEDVEDIPKTVINDYQKDVLGIDKKDLSKKKNIVVLNPFIINSFGINIAASYERFLIKNKKISARVGISKLLQSFDSYSFNNIGANDIWGFHPELKYYPTGAHKKFAYAFGASFAYYFGDIVRGYYSVDNYSQISSYSNYITGYEAGILYITNGFNFFPNDYINFGVELALGKSLFENEGKPALVSNNYFLSKSNNYSFNPAPIIGFKFGYTF